MPEDLDAALAALRPALLDADRLVRAVAAGRRRGATPRWRRVELRPVDLSAGARLQITSYDETQAHTRNHAWGDDASGAVDDVLREPFGNWHVETSDSVVQLRVTKKGEAQVHRGVPSGAGAGAAVRSHDRVKPRLVDPAEPYLHLLGITTADGSVKPTRQDKYKQVEEFVRALDAALPDVSLPSPARVVDLGCGNAYLTLAAYRHLQSRGVSVEMVGVDVKTQAREDNTARVAELGWSEHLRFVEGTILNAPVDAADVVMALHACDTATDEALARAVTWEAPLVLAAPCCHHDVQRRLRASGRVPAGSASLTRHGILRERFADVLTDALRASVLRMVGYRVEVVEFVSTRHTPRNTLIRAVRTGAPPSPDVVEDYRALTSSWGIRPRLEELLEDRLAGVLA